METKDTLYNIPRHIFWLIDEALMLIIPFMLGSLIWQLCFCFALS
jgi:hypothetical protein